MFCFGIRCTHGLRSGISISKLNLGESFLVFKKHLKSAKIGELPKGKVGPLAQLVEQRTFNPWVDGSSPSGPT